MRPRTDDPSDGACCSCGYAGEEETPCPIQEDHVHCVHWWEGVEQPNGECT